MVSVVPAAPAISIVMPLYNKAGQVLETIASVRAQTLSDWELVVVDDGSTDAGPALVRDLQDERIRLVSQANAGVSAARNRGIELARADLVAFLDADDLWLPGFLAAILELAADFPQARWFATGYEIRRVQGNSMVARLRGTPEGFRRGMLPDYFGAATVSDPPVCSSAAAMRRDAIQTVGGFPVGIGSGEDLLTWARLAVRYPLAYDARPLAVFVASGIERRPDKADLVGKGLVNLARQHPGVPGLRRYLGLWYRMQGVMAMRYGEIGLARQQAQLAVRYGPGQLRNLYTLLLTLLPTAWGQALDSRARSLLRSHADKGNTAR
jgi:glycosyltransferase involved in cell wall biosynthesis